MVRKDIRDWASESGLTKLNELSKFSDLIALKTVRDALQNCDGKFKAFLKTNAQFFVDLVKDDMLDKVMDCKKWDDLII